MQFKLGRKPRAHNPRVPHMSALLAGIVLPPPLPAVDYTAALPANLGLMLNDRLGDCTCAGVYHALQVWSANACPPMLTEPDGCVLALYEEACAYNPGDPTSDKGGVEQDVLAYLLNTGAPISGGERHKIAAYVELDPRNTDDVKRAIADCGVVYIGFEVPTYLTSNGPPAVWGVNPAGDQSIEGGHCVILAGYDASTVKLISWGAVYSMTWEFFGKYADEAYALIDTFWLLTSGNTPAGMTLQQLIEQMTALKEM